MFKICALSDTHNMHSKVQVPECDILIHAGDWSYRGTERETRAFAKWLNEQEAGHIIVIPGNHEEEFEKAYPQSISWIKDHCPAANILIHDSLNIEGLNIFGSAWTPYHHDWAYNAGRTITEAAYYRVPVIGDLWAQIPKNTDILITHGPPYDILDETFMVNGDSYDPPRFIGCVELRKVIEEIRPELHIFGHIHGSHGEKHLNGTSFYNVAICDEIYSASNPVTTIWMDKYDK